MIPALWLHQAQERIAAHIQRTPLFYDERRKLYLKWENHQVTGSFKIRGALNKVLSLEAWERSRGLVAASAGNHGQGVALAAKLVGCPATVFVPESAVPAKVRAIQALGAKVIFVPGGYGEAEVAGIRYARENQITWISPYNDGQVIAGQATLALEMLEQLPELREMPWLIPVGGGGLISGIGAALENTPGGHKIIGVQSTASPFFHAIFHRGSQAGVQELPSIADGLAGPVEEGSVTVPLVQRLVDDILLVDEDDIVEAIRDAWFTYGERIEGSAAVTLAAILSGKIAARPAVLILSGGNIQPEWHRELVDGLHG